MKFDRIIYTALVVAALLVGMSIGSIAQAKEPRILAIGDSLMVWNRAQRRSIPQVVSSILKEPVQSRAVSGAMMIYALPISGAMGMRIPSQYRDDGVDWVVVNGGGNDLWLGCGCRRCDGRMNRMISANGTRGDVPKLIKDIRATKAKVIYIGYLRSPGVGSAIDHCRNEGNEYERRIEAMAKSMDGVYFISNADLVPSGDRSFHDKDLIHPSEKASIEIAKRVVQVIRKYDPTR